jgi:pre-rRNA-processing protein TSR1
MPASVEHHSHRSTTKVAHKPFKARKTTKGALKELSKGKTSRIEYDGLQLSACRQAP